MAKSQFSLSFGTAIIEVCRRPNCESQEQKSVNAVEIADSELSTYVLLPPSNEPRLDNGTTFSFSDSPVAWCILCIMTWSTCGIVDFDLLAREHVTRMQP